MEFLFEEREDRQCRFNGRPATTETAKEAGKTGAVLTTNNHRYDENRYLARLLPRRRGRASAEYRRCASGAADVDGRVTASRVEAVEAQRVTTQAPHLP